MVVDMLIKSETSAMTVCVNCGAEERRLLHQVRHRSVFRRLCTTCVLRLHPQGFCPSCFQVYSLTPPNDAVRICVKCYSHSHSHCSETVPASNPYVCPLCVHPNAPLFKLKESGGEDCCRVMDRQAARMLLAAAKIACASMNKAAVAARAEAERRVKEAALTRKRAKEALEHVAHLVMKERVRARGDGMGRNGSGYRNGGFGSNAAAAEGAGAGTGAGNVDRDSSKQVLAEALNAVELRGADTMDVDEGGMGVKVEENVGEMNDVADMEESGAGNDMVSEKKQNTTTTTC